MESPPSAPARGLYAPFGVMGLAAGIYSASLLIPDGCALRTEDAPRVHAGLLVGLPVVLMLLARVVAMKPAQAVLVVTLLPPPLFGLALATPLAIAGGLPGAFLAGLLVGYLTFPLGAAWVSVIRLTLAAQQAHADDPPAVQRFFAIDRWLRTASGVACIAFGASVMLWSNARLAMQPFRSMGWAIALGSLLAFAALQRARRRAVEAGGRTDAMATSVYRAPDEDPIAQRTDEVARDLRSDTLDLAMVAILALSAAVAFFTAKQPAAPREGPAAISWPSVD